MKARIWHWVGVKSTQITIWAQINRVVQDMNAVEMLRVGLEAAIAVQLALLALFILVVGNKRNPAGFFLSALCATLVVEVLLNALASAGVVPSLRILNYFIDLAMAPVLFGFVARAGEEGSPLRRMDALHLAGPVIGGFVLVSGIPHGPDTFMLAIQSGYLVSSLVIGWRRRTVLWNAGLQHLAIALISAFTVVMGLRLWVVLDARSLQSYRESTAYIAILVVLLALSSYLSWAAMRRPGMLAWRAALAPRGMDANQAAELERNLVRLIEDEQLYLEPNLMLKDVAARLGVSPRFVSHVISTRLRENFSGFVNRKRVEAAVKALRTPDRVHLTRVMFQSGFGSKSAFQREFKRCCGVTPTEYRRQFLEAQVGG